MQIAMKPDATPLVIRDEAMEFQRALASVVIGQDAAIRMMTIAVLARGHVLLEGDVGVGKTTLLRAVARALGGPYQRIEGTIDLMPGDMLYSAFVGEGGRPRMEPGPLLARGEDLAVFFFNEINRARPQVHSLLLRLMAERSTTAFQREFAFPHLQVFADRNKVERDETFELPAAARDRFFMEIPVEAPDDRGLRRALAFDTRYHDADTLIGEIQPGILPYRDLNRRAETIQAHVRSSRAVEDYVVSLWDAVRHPARHGLALPGVDMERLVDGGVSPRGVSALVRAARVHAFLEGRDALVPEDVRAVFPCVMGHRIFLAPMYEIRRDTIVPALIDALFGQVAAPA